MHMDVPQALAVAAISIFSTWLLVAALLHKHPPRPDRLKA